MAVLNQTIDWQNWMRRWDAQQTGYLPFREARFNAMLDVLDALMPPSFVAVDLACGPGSLSQRLLDRFPQARCVAIDLDPVLMTMGQAVLGNRNGRLRWVEADLTTVDLLTQGESQVDAVLSTTALHWLPTPRLLQVYEQLGRWIRPDGVFLNGDNIPFAPNLPTFKRVSDRFNQHQQQTAFAALNPAREDWQQWWQALAAEPGLQELLQERDRRFTQRGEEEHPIYDLHEAALRNAGFREVGTVWQSMDDRVLMGVR